MVDKILTSVGIPCAETAFAQQPDGVYAVWGERIEADGSDYGAELLRHDVTVEVYEPAEHVGREERRRLIEALDDRYRAGLIGRWSCDMRVWLLDVRLYLTTYTFSYIERRS